MMAAAVRQKTYVPSTYEPPSAATYDIDPDDETRNSAIDISTEDKQAWCTLGEVWEREFVAMMNERGGCGEFSINPEKARNKYAPDLSVDGKIGDLKYQKTPFFTSKKYGLPSRYTVAFNVKDYDRYSKKYSGIDIYFWVDWKQTRSQWGEVEYFSGVFRVPFAVLAKIIESGKTPKHVYQRRQGSHDGNAEDSYYFDVRSFELLFLVPGCTMEPYLGVPAVTPVHRPLARWRPGARPPKFEQADTRAVA